MEQDFSDSLKYVSFEDDNDIKAVRAKRQDEADSKTPKKATGTFASMGLSRLVLKAILRKGYKLATPIQRKCIPPIMTGRDVVAMARTGSGKSAAFLLPIVDKLKLRQPKQGIRALIVSPTRELATQTFKFARDFSKYTNLVTKLIIGGDSISKDFETITSSPDILIATPGRLAHVLVEMKQKLNFIETVVFDEADRLFEPGYKEMEQVNEICLRLPDSKQTLLFSATMPQKLADFAKVGLKNPLFVRLDVESNLSDTLKCVHLHCNQNDKFAILLHLLKNFVQKDQMTVVFMPTKHHIEYAKMLLDKARVNCSHVYSSLDPEARKLNVDRFTSRKCKVMLVTDIAARGIDIPLLDIVINYNFPFKPKLYVHRVGRVARAGRFGCAISLVAFDETPYLHALHLFFSMPLKIAADLEDNNNCTDIERIPNMVLGLVPQNVLDDENEILKKWHLHDDELLAMVKVCDNAMKPYLKTRQPADKMSGDAAKQLHKKILGIHPMFGTNLEDVKRVNMLDKIKFFKPKASEIQVQVGDGPKANSKKNSFADERFYLKYKPDHDAKEKGLEIDRATMDLMPDEEDKMKSQRHSMIWDRKKKKYVRPENDFKNKKIKTESGAIINASYSTGLFEKWKNQSKFDQKEDNDDKRSEGINRLRSKLKPTKKKRGELNTDDQILKQRIVTEKRETILRLKQQRKSQRNSRSGRSGGANGGSTLRAKRRKGSFAS